MNKDVSESFESHFGVLKDPRIKRLKLYPLTEILFVVLCGTICGKTLCNSIDKQNNVSAIHMVSAFATNARLILAQQKVDEKKMQVKIWLSFGILRLMH